LALPVQFLVPLCETGRATIIFFLFLLITVGVCNLQLHASSPAKPRRTLLFASYLGHAIVCGRHLQDVNLGMSTAGPVASSIPIVAHDARPITTVGWRQPLYWGTGEGQRLPGTTVMFRELSLWERYRRYIVIVLALCVVETVLIFGLLLEREKRKRSESQRRRSEEAIRTIVEGVRGGSSDGYFTSMALLLAKCLGADHTLIGELIHDANGLAVKTVGVCKNGAIGENLVYHLAGTPCDHVMSKGVCSYTSGVATAFPKDVSLRDMGAEGYTGVPLFSSRGEPLGIMVALYNRRLENAKFAESLLQVFSAQTAAEIERRQAGEAMRRSEAELRSFAENAPFGISRSSVTEDRFLSVNPALVRMLGYDSKDELLALNLARDVYQTPQELVDLFAESQPDFFSGKEFTLKRKGGKLITVRASGRRVHDNGADGDMIETVVEDVTQQRAMQEELKQSQKMEAMGRLAGGVAHDFNNLLGVILGYSESLVGDFPPESAAIAKVEAIRRAGDRAAALTAQLLGFSRRQPVQPKILDLNAIVAEAEKMLRRLIGEDIELRVMVDSGLARVKADPGQMVQVVVNLALNARDAMLNGGKLTIQTANLSLKENISGKGVSISPGEYVLLLVRDTGVGMDDQTLLKIFEPFFTTKPAAKGTGMGLAMVSGIIQQNQGHISVESKVGMGSTFRVYLPKVEDAVEAPPSEMLSQSPDGNESILLVEDDPSLRELIRDSLQSRGYDVLAAGNGVDAVQLAQEQRIDLLLTDVIMPGMSGPEVAERITTMRPGTRVLYMSGYTDDKLAHAGILDPEVTLLQKPFRLEDLARKLREVLTRSRR
jgi:PAS domain S-box-containing protein